MKQKPPSTHERSTCLGPLTVIYHTATDDVVLSFSMQSVCLFILINVVFLTLSPPLLFASILFAAIYLIYQVHPFIYWWIYLSWGATEIKYAKANKPKPLNASNCEFRKSGKHRGRTTEMTTHQQAQTRLQPLWSVSVHKATSLFSSIKLSRHSDYYNATVWGLEIIAAGAKITFFLLFFLRIWICLD